MCLHLRVAYLCWVIYSGLLASTDSHCAFAYWAVAVQWWHQPNTHTQTAKPSKNGNECRANKHAFNRGGQDQQSSTTTEMFQNTTESDVINIYFSKPWSRINPPTPFPPHPISVCSCGGQDSLVDKALDYRPKGTGFHPRFDHKRCSTWATYSFSMWDNKDLLILQLQGTHIYIYVSFLFKVFVF
jgi:hypothetical protein